MRVHETQAAFLKVLIAHEDGEASLQLRESLAKADRESKRIRQTLFLMVMFFVLAVAGLGYCAVLLPQVFSNPTHWVILSLSVLALASLIAQVECLGYLLWHRLAENRLHKECRRRVLLLLEARLKDSLRQSPGVDSRQEPGGTMESAPSSSQDNLRPVQTRNL